MFSKINEYEIIDSTNEEAKRFAAGSEKNNIVIWAKQQTGGRGRSGREWISESGNLYCSLLLYPEFSSEAASQLSFVTAVAARDAIGNDDIKLKWPNDILVNNKKCGGILLEASITSKLNYLIIGLGINIINSPVGTEFPATNLKSEGIEAEPETLLHKFIDNFEKKYNIWLNDGFEQIRKEWLKNAVNQGEIIRVRTVRETLSGTFKDIDEHGALVLHCGNKERLISAGDVFFDKEEKGSAVSR